MFYECDLRTLHIMLVLSPFCFAGDVSLGSIKPLAKSERLEQEGPDSRLHLERFLI